MPCDEVSAKSGNGRFSALDWQANVTTERTQRGKACHKPLDVILAVMAFIQLPSGALPIQR